MHLLSYEGVGVAMDMARGGCQLYLASFLSLLHAAMLSYDCGCLLLHVQGDK